MSVWSELLDDVLQLCGNEVICLINPELCLAHYNW